MSRKAKILLIVGVVLLIIVSPIVLTMNSRFDIFDFSQTGQIGDTIGGITSPIINFMGAILVYLSFNEQSKANKIQEKALFAEIRRNADEKKYNTIFHDIESLRSDIIGFTLEGSKETKIGSSAFFIFQEQIKRNHSPEYLGNEFVTQNLNQLGFILTSTYAILLRINKSEMEEDDVNVFKTKLKFIYMLKVGVYVDNILDVIKDSTVNSDVIGFVSTLNNKINSELPDSI